MPQKTIGVTARLHEKYRIDVQAENHLVRIDQPPSGGGADTGPTPLQYLLGAVAGCIGTVGRIVAKQRNIALRGMSVAVEGDIDTDFLLGRTRSGRAGFQAIRVRVEIDADMTRDEKMAFLREVDARCPVSENLLNPTSLEISVR